MNHKMGVTCGAGCVYPSGPLENTPRFLCVCIAQYLVLNIALCELLFVFWSFFLVFARLCLFDSNLYFGIFLIALSNKKNCGWMYHDNELVICPREQINLLSRTFVLLRIALFSYVFLWRSLIVQLTFLNV